MPEKISQSVFSINNCKKEIVVSFDQEHASIDGGALLLGKADERLGLSAALAGRIRDSRQVGKVEHGVDELLRQRLYAIGLGYADANDAGKLREEAVHQLLTKGEVGESAKLGSQASLSRFENSVTRGDLGRMSYELSRSVLKRHKKRLKGKAKKVVIDLDGTDDPTHGQQQFSFFNGYYDEHCYLPYIGTLQFNNETEQYAICGLLRAGNASAAFGAVPLLRRLVGLLREYFPRIQIVVRLDAGFGSPEVLEFLDDEHLKYVVGFPSNTVLAQIAAPLVKQAVKSARRYEESAVLWGETQYEAGTWDDERRVIFKAEALFNSRDDIRENPRFVVTNFKQSPEFVYKYYTQRGDMENRLKELHHGLEMDRLSCHRFLANQFRLILAVAAYVLFQEIRLCARGTDCEHAQVWTLRERLFKIGAWVECSVRRIVLHLPKYGVWLQTWRRVANALGAATA